VRSASPPATTTERAGIAEGSPAGEMSGRGAVPGSAQDGETSTVDQSREWPYRDTAPRQDPAESRLDPIWGSDPPDAVRWHMGMTTEEAATAHGQDGTTNAQAAQAQPHDNGTTDPARSTESASEGRPGEAARPVELGTEHGKSKASASRSPHEAGSEVGWFSTGSGAGEPGAGQYNGTLSKQLSAERPGEEPPEGLSAGVTSARVPGDVEMDAPDTAGPELIQSGMVYVDPDPEIGSPPGAAGWTERSATGLLPNDGPSSRAGAAMPEERGAGHAEARDIVNSPDAGSSDEPEDDSTGMAVPAPTDDPEAGKATDPGISAATGQAANALPGDVTSSTQAAPEVLGEVPSKASGSAPTMNAEGASTGVEAAGAGRVVDDSHSVGEAVSAAEAAAETAEPTHPGAPHVRMASPAADTEQGATAEVGTEGIRVSKVEDLAEVGGITEADTEVEAERVAGPADAAEASSHSTIGDSPWNEPALPIAWPPGLGPPGREVMTGSRDKEELDPELVPEPDPSWPRLFGQGLEGEESGAATELSNGRQATAGSPQEISREQRTGGAAEHHHSEPEKTVLESGGESDARPSTEKPRGPAPLPEDRDASGAAAAAGAAASTDHPTGRSTDQDMATPHGALEAPDVVPAGAAAGIDAPLASGDADSPPSSKPTIVDVTTGDPGGAGGPPTTQQGGGPPSVGSGGLDARAVSTPVPEGDGGASGHANVSTTIRSADAAEVGEVDLREVSASSRSVDVSRETTADGGEAMDPGREDEALEDEAAIAVRDAVSRAAAEAGVDVSRETDLGAVDFSIDEPSAEATIDSEAAARNARVSFRIHRDTQNGIRRVVAVANQKGGVGKSTTAVNIGAYLALAGARVLVIDLDPQGNASTGLGLDHRDIEPSIYDVLTGEAVPGTAIRATGVPNLHVLPSTIDLAGAEVELVSAMSRETRLRRALQSIDHQYDTILIDCPPSLGLLTVNALAAADELLIPIQCEYYALEGLGQLLRNVELVRANLNPELRIGGIVLTMYDGRTRLALQVVDEVRKHFTDLVYQTVVPRSVRLSEAPGYGLPIALYDPLSRGGIAYRDLTFELAERSGLLSPTGEGAS
jgi:chromosome partitioning protein